MIDIMKTNEAVVAKVAWCLRDTRNKTVARNVAGLRYHSTHTDGYTIIAKDEKGFRYVIVTTNVCTERRKGKFVVGVVRESRRHLAFSWLCNGQVGNKGMQIAYWREGDVFVPYVAADQVWV